jgi:sn-glycerol 3-phosphate transport system substrate-binding protein
MVVGRIGRAGIGRLVVVVVLVSMSALAACGSTGSNSAGSGSSGSGSPADGSSALPPCPLAALDQATAPVNVVVWHSLVAKQNDTLRALADEYNASQGRVHVQIENVAATDEELMRKFTAAVPSRQLPAIFVGNDTETQAMVDSQVILPAQSCIDADHYDMSGFAKTVVDYYTVGGALWPASANPSSALVYYNKDHFRRAGLDPEQPPRTLAELRTDAEKIKAAGIVDKPFVHELASYKTEFLLTGAQSPIVDHDNGRQGAASAAALVGNDTTLGLFRWFEQMNVDGLLQPIPVAEGQINQYLAMANQTASIAIESSGSATSIQAFLGGTLDPSAAGGVTVTTSGSGFDFGAGAFPGINGPGRTQMGGPAWYIVKTTAPEVQAGAWEFAKFMNGEHAQTRMLVDGSYLPYRTDVSESPEAQAFFSGSLAGGWLKIADDQVQTIDPEFPGPLIGPYYETRVALVDALSSMLLGATTPEDAVAGAQRDVDHALDLYAQGGF